MHRYKIIKRDKQQLVENRLKNNPVVALLGPRQCGKSTLAHQILKKHPNHIYLDLEKNTDIAKLSDVWAFFQIHRNELICLDEIQRAPEIFSQIRSFCDEQGTNGQFLILGSASRDLIKQSSESLAGRISYVELSPFSLTEVAYAFDWRDLWLAGGFPNSLLAQDPDNSFDWRLNFVRTFLERDIPQLGFRVPSQVLNRFWTMCAHKQGQLLNATQLGNALGVTHHTIKNYIDILSETFMLRQLNPYHENTKKRLIKSPKLYIRDTGIVHALLGIECLDDLLGHPVCGYSYEGFVIENIIQHFRKYDAYFYRTSGGHEIDLLLVKGNRKIAIEVKVSTTPVLEKGFWAAKKDMQPDACYLVAPVEQRYPLKAGVEVLSLGDLLTETF
ncbi:MAG TPA: ATP-binding protein [Gammaproteobacteria bacterium]|nr:ATP-binding protein [Gammaproteobacteria bacterium]